MHSDILDVAPFNGYQEAWLPNDVDIVDEQVTYDPDDANYFNYYPEQAPVKEFAELQPPKGRVMYLEIPDAAPFKEWLSNNGDFMEGQIGHGPDGANHFNSYPE
ncbi:unnamed protein product [Clavelina lepadiformis]|uniref:Uncharacterized protein n=1 Tax=Clavelina lepadiformis TaxID=159417 RepID=A0ABP0FME5_CLALP